jgi:tol-pal system protein YbgF
MTGRKKELRVVLVTCFLCLAAGIAGCEMATGNMGSGDSVTAGEMERRIIDLEKKLSDLTREVAELNERTTKSEKALDAYLSGTARKSVQEEPIGEQPVRVGEAAAPSAPDGAPPIDKAAPETPATSPSDTALAPKPDEEGTKGPGGPADRTVTPPADITAKDPQSLYDRALSEIMNRKAEAALPLFVKFVKDFPDDELTDNASYWIGECYYLMSDYQKALDQFKGVTERFPGKDKAPDALLKMGYCYDKMGDAAHAKEVYNNLIATFPDSSAADLAREKMK